MANAQGEVKLVNIDVAELKNMIGSLEYVIDEFAIRSNSNAPDEVLENVVILKRVLKDSIKN